MTRWFAQCSAVAVALLVWSGPGLGQTNAPYEGFLYGRITTLDGSVHEGRLRWGNGEEALWSHYYNGRKTENHWAEHAPEEERPAEHTSVGAFGFELLSWRSARSLERPFMTRFGDIARIETSLRTVHVTRKSGDVVALNRFEADDLADGVRVFDATGETAVIDEWQIRAIEFLPAPTAQPSADPLFGTVRTSTGDFTGLLQWNREQSLSSDELVRPTDAGELRVRFDSIQSITPRTPDSISIAFVDGRTTELHSTAKRNRDHRGLYVDDARYGRVLVSWSAVERVDFHGDGQAPSYNDFPPGRPLSGTVVTRDNRRVTGRLVFDLDEAETTDTLDAPSDGVDYTIPFGLVSSIVVPDPQSEEFVPADVRLSNGEALRLEQAGDLAEWNGGMLIFSDSAASEYVPWPNVARVDFDHD